MEEGIGEHRAALLENGECLAARVLWPTALMAGAVLETTLIARTSGSARGTARTPSGDEILIDGLSRETSEGSTLKVLITRGAIAETGRFKRPQGRPAPDAKLRLAPSLADSLRSEGPFLVKRVRRFPKEAEWGDIVSEAQDATFFFPHGSITISLTPAMTLIDIDGTLPPQALALAAIPSITNALQRMDLAGSIGIDFPTQTEKAHRRSIDEALASALQHWPHERTAINGFGFVQIVARLERPSLLHRFHYRAPEANARHLLRQAEHIQEPGALLFTCNPKVREAIAPFENELASRTGRTPRFRLDGYLEDSAGFVQATPL